VNVAIQHIFHSFALERGQAVGIGKPGQWEALVMASLGRNSIGAGATDPSMGRTSRRYFRFLGPDELCRIRPSQTGNNHRSN
jgi:hypothetical protein